MNTGMIGADPRALREMAASFDGAAEKLMGVTSSVQVWVDRADIWRGLDNRQFADGWDATDSRAITNAATILRRYADILRANAEAQDTASASDGSALAGSGLFAASAAGARQVASTSTGSESDFSFWRQFAGTADSLVNHPVVPGWSVGDLTEFLAARGLSTGPGAALGIALAAPEFVEEMLDPDTSTADSLGSAGVLAMEMVSEGLMSAGVHSKNPALALAGVGSMVWGTVVSEARYVDLSSDALATTAEFVKENPWSIGEEMGKAIMTLSGDWGKKASRAIIGGVFGP